MKVSEAKIIIIIIKLYYYYQVVRHFWIVLLIFIPMMRIWYNKMHLANKMQSNSFLKNVMNVTGHTGKIHYII